MESGRDCPFSHAPHTPVAPKNRAPSRKLSAPSLRSKSSRSDGVAGAVLDVVVDLRFGSPTFGKWTSARLSESNQHSIYIPAGFAHGL